MEADTNPQQDQQPAPPKLDLKDLLKVAQVIDLAAARGAIRGPEMRDIGELRDKIVAFISAHTPAEPAAGKNPSTP